MPRRDRFEPPGPRLEPEGQPELFREIAATARATGQSMPREVFLDLSLNAGVLEVGSVLGIGGRRVMVLGLPLLQVLTQSQLRTILAHEFGHFYGGDTRLAPWVYKTRAAMVRTIIGLRGRSHAGAARVHR